MEGTGIGLGGGKRSNLYTIRCVGMRAGAHSHTIPTKMGGRDRVSFALKVAGWDGIRCRDGRSPVAFVDY